jgi:hypothetical protein
LYYSSTMCVRHHNFFFCLLSCYVSWTHLGVRCLYSCCYVSWVNAGLLARSQFTSGRPYDWPTRSRFSRANVELVPKFQVALRASHAALPMETLKILPCTNVTLIFVFDFGLYHPVHGGYGWGSPTPRRRSKCQTKKLKSGLGPHWGPGTKTNWPTDHGSQCNLKLNLRHCTANYWPVLSSERAPSMKNKEGNCHSYKFNIWSLAAKGARHQDELADWPSVAI